MWKKQILFLRNQVTRPDKIDIQANHRSSQGGLVWNTIDSPVVYTEDEETAYKHHKHPILNQIIFLLHKYLLSHTGIT